MNRAIKNILKQILAFVSDQYLVLFFILALGIKLYFFSTYITKVTWSDYYTNGINTGYLSAALVFLPLLFVRKYKNVLATILAFLFSVLILIDILYYSYFASLPTVGLLSSVGQTQDIGPAISAQLFWWQLLFFSDVVLAIILLKPLKQFFIGVKDRHRLKMQNVMTTWAFTVVVLIGFCLSLLPVGLNNLTDVMNKGFDTVSTSQYYGVLVAHTIDTIRIINQETTHLSATQEKDLSNWVKDNKPAQTTDELTGMAKGKNVIMIQVESMGGFTMGQTVNGKELMPNLDKLASQSQFFPNDRFLYGAGHTSDTDFVANTSYFPLNDAAVFIRYGQDDFSSLPKTLAKAGYSTYAYHGFNRNFWNRNVTLGSLGYQKFYAADSYPKSEKLNMGIMDGDFLNKTADYIKSQPKPSLSYIITLTSHVPFATNEKTTDLGINIKDYPEQVGGYLENIHYVDQVLGQLFDKLKSEKLYDDSLILVYGDHTPVLPAFKTGTIDYDPATIQEKEVPLIIKLPNKTDGKTYKDTGVHINITPTVFDLLGIKTNQLMFGQSLFATGDKGLKVCKDQLVSFASKDCKTMLETEKLKSDMIIRYNQFNNLPK